MRTIKSIKKFISITLILVSFSCTTNTPQQKSVQHVDIECPGEIVPSELEVNCYTQKIENTTAAFAVLKTQNPKHNPVLFLHGGPGGRAIQDRDIWLAPRSLILENQDLILIDQRGSGESKPSLDCWELDKPEKQLLELISECKTRLLSKQIDFANYDVENIATDIVKIRNSLGIKKWDLYGVSFGTRIALELLELDGEAVDYVVLDSPLPKHVKAYDSLPTGSAKALRMSLDNCLFATSYCKASLSTSLDELLHDLSASPILITTQSGHSENFNDFRFAHLLSISLAHPNGPELIPKAVALASEGRWAEAINSLEDMEVKGYSSGDRLSEGAQFSSECLDEIPKNEKTFEYSDDILIAALNRIETEVRAVCEVWIGSTLKPKKINYKEFSNKTLILSGKLDPVTPNSWAHETLKNFTQALLIEKKYWTHTPSLNNLCAKKIVSDFLIGEDQSHLEKHC